MRILQVSDFIFDMDENGEPIETEFHLLSTGVFFMHKDQTFVKSIGPFCLSMEDYIIYKLYSGAKVKTIFSISFDR